MTSSVVERSLPVDVHPVYRIGERYLLFAEDLAYIPEAELRQLFHKVDANRVRLEHRFPLDCGHGPHLKKPQGDAQSP